MRFHLLRRSDVRYFFLCNSLFISFSLTLVSPSESEFSKASVAYIELKLLASGSIHVGVQDGILNKRT